jgi:hypothetical protein
MRCNALLLAASTGLLLPEVYAQTSGTPPDFFEMKVRPVLANSCYSGHAGTAMGGLRLDSRDVIGSKRPYGRLPGKPICDFNAPTGVRPSWQ